MDDTVGGGIVGFVSRRSSSFAAFALALEEDSVDIGKVARSLCAFEPLRKCCR